MSEGFDWLAGGCPEELVIKPPPLAIPPERAILLDLIAELRARPGRDVHSGSEHVDVLLAAADRAEQRLREVSGDE